MPRKRKDKKKKASISQQVNVYVTKRGGSRRPPQPSQAQQALQTLVPLVRQLQPIQPTAPPLISSQQLLQLLANLKGEKGEQGEKGDTGRQGGRGFPGRDFLDRVQEQARESAVSEYGTPRMSESSGASLPSFAFDFPTSGRQFVSDQPDSPLVQPAQPAVSAEPIRLDPPHEDVPLDLIGEGKQEERITEEVLFTLLLDDDGNLVDSKLERVPIKPKKTGQIGLRDLVRALDITMPRGRQTAKDYRDAIREYYRTIRLPQ